MPAGAVRIVWHEAPRHGPVNFGLIDTGLAAIDDDQQMRALGPRCWKGLGFSRFIPGLLFRTLMYLMLPIIA